jgi:hypothetical protein
MSALRREFSEPCSRDRCRDPGPRGHDADLATMQARQPAEEGDWDEASDPSRVHADYWLYPTELSGVRDRVKDVVAPARSTPPRH